MRRIPAISAAGLSALFVLAIPPAPALARTAVIVIDKLAYGPAPAGLHVGDSIQWINRDIFKHSVTATNGTFDLDLAVGAKGSVVLKKVGMVSYFCRYHPQMKGTLSVAK